MIWAFGVYASTISWLLSFYSCHYDYFCNDFYADYYYYYDLKDHHDAIT